MNTLKKLQNRRSKQDDILNKAEEVFLQKGFDNTSVDDITSNAGIAKGTFYLYFKSKDEILEAIRARAQDVLLVMLNKSTKTKYIGNNPLEDFFVTYFEFAEKYPMYFSIYNYCIERQAKTERSQISVLTQANEKSILSLWGTTVFIKLPTTDSASYAVCIHEILLSIISRYLAAPKESKKKYKAMLESFYDLVVQKISLLV